MYDDILLPTDGSQGMDGVTDHAYTLARDHDATLHAVYVVETASLTSLPMESSMEGVSQILYEEGHEALQSVEERVEDIDLETTMLEGSAAREIVAAAKEQDCDLVVMGTHGRSGFDRLLLGSVAERVVRSSPVPVLTVRVDAGEK